MITVELIRARLEGVQRKIQRAAEKVGRNPDDVRLVVVTKAQPVEVVRLAIQAGALILGENYADEAVAKQKETGAPGVSWHMIGHVQGRKAASVAGRFDFVHSVDSVKLARRLDQAASREAGPLPVLIQLNVSGEASKSGFPAWAEEHWVGLRQSVLEISAFTALDVRGWMSIPPPAAHAEEARPYFAWTALLGRRLNEALGGRRAELSMGMSGDFEVAVEEGATLVRVGTAILGGRT